MDEKTIIMGKGMVIGLEVGNVLVMLMGAVEHLSMQRKQFDPRFHITLHESFPNSKSFDITVLD